MNSKIVSFWIWMFVGIIVVITVIFANNYLINPKSKRTFAITDIPEIKQADLNTDFEIHRKGETLAGRTVADPAWCIIDKLNLNEIKLPPVPKLPDPPIQGGIVDDKPPTIDDAKADLAKRIRIDGVISPISANVQLLDTSQSVMLIPYERLNPNVKTDIQLSDKHKYYDDLTEIGLPVKCVSIHPEGVILDYDFTKGNFTETFRLFLPMKILVTKSLEEWEENNPELKRNLPPGGVKNTNGNVKKKNSPINYGNKPIEPNDEDISHFKNLDNELAGLGLTTVRNNKGEPGGVRITKEPKEGSLAQKYGMKKNDTIISINSVPVNSVAEGRKWVTNNPDESSYTVVYVRNGVEQTRTIQNPNK